MYFPSRCFLHHFNFVICSFVFPNKGNPVRPEESKSGRWADTEYSCSSLYLKTWFLFFFSATVFFCGVEHVFLTQNYLVTFRGSRPFSIVFFMSFLHLINSKILLTFVFYLPWFLFNSDFYYSIIFIILPCWVNWMKGLILLWQFAELLKLIIFIFKGIICSHFNITFILWMHTLNGKTLKKRKVHYPYSVCSFHCTTAIFAKNVVLTH